MIKLLIRAAIITLVVAPVFLGVFYGMSGDGFAQFVGYMLVIGFIPATLLTAGASLLVYHVSELRKIFEHKIFIAVNSVLILVLYLIPFDESSITDTFFGIVAFIFICFVVSLTMIATRYFGKQESQKS